MADTIRSALEQAAHELDIAENALLCSSFHNAASRAKQAAMTARAALSQPEPAGQIPPDYIDPQHTGADRELLQAYYAACWSEGGTVDEVTLRGLRAAIAVARAQRQPVPPEPGEVQELVKWLREQEGWMGACAMNSRIADLLAQRYPQPVPVSERLPGPEDCDSTGRCWLRRKYQPDGPTWRLTRPASIGTEALRLHYAEWLPAHALPLPVEVEHG